MGLLTTFEHERLIVGDALTIVQWRALTAFHARPGNGRYFDLIHRGIKLKSYVGVLRVGELRIEILPKLDNAHGPARWRDRLLDMLSVSAGVRSYPPSTSHLRTRPGDILEYYLDLLCTEAERLLHTGLVKTYRTRSGNRTALRGRLLLRKQLTENALHRERFHVADHAYTYLQPLNQLLRQGIRLARRLATSAALRSRLAAVDLHFPKLPELPATEKVFDRLRYDRKTEGYRRAMGIVRLLLLQYRPAIRQGGQDTLAILFDMHRLWEAFLLASLRRYLPETYRARGGIRDTYWVSERYSARLIPDIGIYRKNELIAILDAKWKRHARPAPQDLQQLSTYLHHFGVARAALLYPAGGAGTQVRGEYRGGGRGDLLWLPVRAEGPVDRWMEELAGVAADWLTAATA